MNDVSEKTLDRGRAEGFGTEADATQKPLRQAVHLPPRYYTSEEIFAIEREKFFLRDWLAVARVEDFPNPGDYRTYDVVGEPIAIAKDLDGKLNAFVNSCRHRGVAVAIGEGNRRDFTCPYHAWNYDLAGRLVAPSRGRELANFDVKNCRMPPIRLDVWGGYVFICFDPDGPSLGEYLDVDGFREATAYLRPDDTVLVDTHSYEIDCNWKLVPENLADIYHVNVIHLGTFGGRKYSPDRALKETNYTKYGWNREYISGTMAPDGELLFGPMPWLADHPKKDQFAFSAFLRPNFYLFARADMIQPWVVYPISATRSRVVGWTCMPKEFTQRPAFKEKLALIKDFARKFSGEDFELMAAIQRGLSSRYFVRGPMHDLEEMIHHRINCYLRALEGDGDQR